MDDIAVDFDSRFIELLLVSKDDDVPNLGAEVSFVGEGCIDED